MKLFLTSRPIRAGLVAILASTIIPLQDVHASASTTIVADQDSAVDSLVPFPYKGHDDHLTANYDTSFGTWISRSYIRFPLASIDPIAHVLSARIDLNCNMALAGGGTIEVYRSDNDSWPENGINFGNQPGWSGVRLAIGPVSTTGSKSIPLSLANWTHFSDINDGHVTFVLKTLESSRVDTIRFDSRDMSGGSPPKLVITVRNPGNILNPDMDDGLTGWSHSGTVTATAHPWDPGNPVALLETASQSAMWQQIDTPDVPFAIEFDADFLTDTGTFTVLINGQVVYSVTTPEGPRGGTAVFDPSLFGLTDVDLKFTLDGPDGVTSQLFLDELNIYQIPIPQLMMTPAAATGNATLSFYAEPGGWYDIETTTDLQDWHPHGRRISGRLDMLYEELIPAPDSRRFFRLQSISYSEPSELPIPNQGFELPVLGDNENTTAVPDWTSTGGAGVWNPPASVYSEEQPEGTNVAFVHNGHSLSQTLTHVLEPYRIYTLDALLGKRHDITWPTATPPDLILRAGGVALTPFETHSPAISVGTFDPWWRRYKIGKTHPQLGEPLEIILHGGTSGVVSQVNFDTVILEVE